MILSLICHGLFIIVTLIIFCKWFDDSLSIDICFYGLLVELIFSFTNISYIYYCDYLFFLNFGNIFDHKHIIKIYLVLFFDEISNLFYFILSFALLLCFYFLIEYFEYDFNSTSIIILSSLFSQIALWFFCTFDLFLLIFFWESISIISFFLIQYWSFRIPSYKASIKVFFISQLGDLPFFLFLFLLINRFETTDMFEIQSNLFIILFEYINILNFNIFFSISFVLSFLLSFSLFLKSAQFFFYPWLLDAMEAPVPISAQLHSSTLVIIGFYTFFRFQNLVIMSPYINFLILIFGLITVVYSSILGFFQNDGKKLLACSTASQLGYVLVGLGLCFFEESLLMLSFCCINKAITFIWFGILMDKYSGLSDIRLVSGIHKFSILEHTGILVSLCNFTIIPGLFSWQLKVLYLKGQMSYDFFLIKYSLDILLLTWFFASLYFFSLYISLFLKSSRLAFRGIQELKSIYNFKNITLLNFINSIISLSIYLIFFKSFIYIKLKFFYFFNNFFLLKNSINLINIDKLNISASFFSLLFFSFLFLVNAEIFFYDTMVDTTWVNNYFYFYDFLVYDFYLF